MWGDEILKGGIGNKVLDGGYSGFVDVGKDVWEVILGAEVVEAGVHGGSEDEAEDSVFSFGEVI